jgi:hypothetical protein
MLKIERALLEAKFPTIDVDNLLEVVMATQNTTVAVELLCGLYKSPEPIVSPVTKGDRECHFESYDKWTDQVHYSYQQADTKSAYFPEGTKATDVTMENFESLKVSNSSNADWLSIKTGEYSLRQDRMSLSQWNEYSLKA